MSERAATWFREQHTCNALCREGRHAQMVFVRSGESFAALQAASARLYAIRALALEPAPEFDPTGYGVREWDRHGRSQLDFDDPGTPHLLLYEDATPRAP